MYKRQTPHHFAAELVRLANEAPSVGFVMLTYAELMEAMDHLFAPRPENLAVISEPVGDEALEDALTVLLADRV